MKDDRERERINKNIVQLPYRCTVRAQKGVFKGEGKEKRGRKGKKRGDHAPLHPL